jgi:hypothetical protein
MSVSANTRGKVSFHGYVLYFNLKGLEKRSNLSPKYRRKRVILKISDVEINNIIKLRKQEDSSLNRFMKLIFKSLFRKIRNKKAQIAPMLELKRRLSINISDIHKVIRKQYK